MLENLDTEFKLKILYLYTMISTILVGILVLAAPSLFWTLSDMPEQDQFIFGIVGSVWLAFGICSALALRNLRKFVPVLLMQLIYKVIWIVVVFLPLTITGQGGIYGILLLIVFLTYVIPDLLFIPWKELLEAS